MAYLSGRNMMVFHDEYHLTIFIKDGKIQKLDQGKRRSHLSSTQPPLKLKEMPWPKNIYADN